MKASFQPYYCGVLRRLDIAGTSPTMNDAGANPERGTQPSVVVALFINLYASELYPSIQLLTHSISRIYLQQVKRKFRGQNTHLVALTGLRWNTFIPWLREMDDLWRSPYCFLRIR
jgi:hypothetical protein